MIALALSNARRALTDRKGVTAAEYAVLAVGIIIAVTAAVAAFQTPLTTAFTNLVKLPT